MTNLFYGYFSLLFLFISSELYIRDNATIISRAHPSNAASIKLNGLLFYTPIYFGLKIIFLNDDNMKRKYQAGLYFSDPVEMENHLINAKTNMYIRQVGVDAFVIGAVLSALKKFPYDPHLWHRGSIYAATPHDSQAKQYWPILNKSFFRNNSKTMANYINVYFLKTKHFKRQPFLQVKKSIYLQVLGQTKAMSVFLTRHVTKSTSTH